MTNEDARLRELLAPPQRPVDRDFVGLVVRDVEIAQRWRRARRAAWRHFALDAATAGALLAPAWLASTLVAPGQGPGHGLILMIILGSCGFIFRPAGMALR